jgi:LPS-assembly protein
MNNTSFSLAVKPHCIVAIWCICLLFSSILLSNDNVKKTEQTTAPKTTPGGKLGWKCVADDDAWDCKRSGPISEQLAISEKEKEQKQEATISAEDERRFKTLLTQLQINPWAGCQTIATRAKPLAKILPRDHAQFDIDADFVEAQEREITTFIGNVDVTRADQRIKSHFATYDAIAETVLARDDVVYTDKGMALLSDTLFLNLQNNTGKLRNSIFIVGNIPARGQARNAYFESMQLSRYEDAAYTTCPPGNQDWVIHAERLNLDREQGWGIANNAWLKFMNIPFLYTPYMSFPIDDRRKSGLLAISFDSSEESGFGLTVPYYWNIAPNFDATIAPRLLTGRGFMLGGEFRYLTDNSAGEIAAEVLTYDRQKQQVRGQVSVLHSTVFTPELRGYIDGHFVSDNDYLDQLGNTLGITNNRHVHSQARLDYTTNDFSLLSRVDNYQTIDDTINDVDRPYRRLPQILFTTTARPVWETGALADMYSEYVFFQQKNRVTGQRLDVRPSITYPMEREYGYIHPKVTVAHTQYWYGGDNTELDSDGITKRQFSHSNSRTLPIASIDASLFLEQDINLGGMKFLHQIQPQLFYVYIPYKNQRDIPWFDSSKNDFSFFQLFRPNRFAGGDRIGDTNHLTAAFTSSFVDAETGRERLRLSIGEIFYFQDRKVRLFGRECAQLESDDFRCTPETRDFSNIIGELAAPLTNDLYLKGTVHWDPVDKKVRRRQVELQYHDENNVIINLGYRFRNDENNINNDEANISSINNLTDTFINQIDGSFHLPIIQDWSIIGRMQYSFENEIILDSFLGFEHDNCCWRLRIMGRHYINDFSNRTNQENSHTNNAVFVQLELKGLASFGNKRVGKFLERNIKSYRVSEF